MKTIATGLIGILIAASASGAVIRNDVNSIVRLGYGIDPEVGKVYSSSPCVDFEPADVTSEDGRNPNDKTPTSTKLFNVSKEVITSSLKIDEYSHTSVSGSIQYMAASGGFNMDQKDVFKLSSDQLAIGIKAEADYGRWYLKNPKLNPKKADLAKRDLPQFFKECGHEYVNGFKLGQGISVLLTTASLVSLKQHSFSASTNASVGGDGIKASVAMTFEQSAMELIKYGSVQVKVTGYGNSGLSGISGTLTSDQDVHAFTKQITDIIEKMNNQDATKSAYVTSPYPGISSTYSPFLAEAKHATYESLFSDFRQVLADLGRMQKIKRTGFAGQFTDYCSKSGTQMCLDYGNYLDHISDLDQKALLAIDAAAQKCVQGTSEKDCVSSSVWNVNPTLHEVPLANSKLADFRASLYQALVDGITKRK